MSSVFSLSFTPTGYSVSGAWPLATTPAKVTTSKLGTPFTVAGLATAATHAWKPAAGKPLTIDTAKNAAVFGEFALDAWIRDVSLVEPVTLIGGPGSPVELVLTSAGAPELFSVTATIRTTGAPIVLRSGTFALDPAATAPLHIGVWVTGTEAAWVVNDTVAARVQLAASIPDARGKAAIGTIAKGSASVLTIEGVWLRDQLDAVQEKAIADAAAAGIGAIDAFVATGAAPYLGAPESSETVYGTIRTRTYQHGNVYWSPTTGAHDVGGRILRAYLSEGGHLGPLGLPTSQEMSLDAVLDFVNAPRAKGSSGITLGDILKEYGKLKASDFVVEGVANAKPKPAKKRRDWDVFASATKLADVARMLPADPPLDAAWIATALGHTQESPDFGQILEQGEKRRHQFEGGRVKQVLIPHGAFEAGQLDVEPAGIGGARANQLRQVRGGGLGVDDLGVDDGVNAVIGVAPVRAKTWKLAAAAGAAKVSEADAAHVLRLPKVAAKGLTFELPAVAAETALDPAILGGPADKVTVEADAVPRLLSALGAQLAAGTVTTGQAMGLSPDLYLRHPIASGLIESFAADADAPAFGGVAKNRKDIGGLLDTASELRDGIRIEFEGVGWNLLGPRAQLFEHGIIVQTAREAFPIYENILALWLILGGSRGFLGVPQGREAAPLTKYDGPADSRSVVFGGGRVYWSPRTGAHEVHGAILAHYLAKSSDAVALFVPPNSSHLGLPTSDEQDVIGVRGARLSTFEHGSIYWTAKLGPVIVTQPILDGFLISGGVSHWGMPTAPARVAVKGDTTITWQRFERGVLAHTDKVGWFDSLQVRIARVDAGAIDDDGAFEPEDKKAELYIKAWVWANGQEKLHRESPAGNNPSFAVVDGWVTGSIPLREDIRIDLKIEAWDWDKASGNDHLADHSATFTFGDDLFGYADTLGDHPNQDSTWNDSREASATAVKFSYTIAPHVDATLGGLRQNNFYRFPNRGRKTLPWDMYHETFADIEAPDRGSAEKVEREFFDKFYTVAADGGDCYGFSTSALDAFEGRNELEQPLSDDTTAYGEVGDPVWHIINRGQGSFHSANVWQWIADCQASINVYDPRKVWARVDALIRATGKPVVLNLTGKTSGHAVLVYRTDATAAGARRMFHADSNAPWPANGDDSVITIAANGSYTLKGYADYTGPAWMSGVLPPVRMIEMPESVIAQPRVTPYWYLKTGLIGFFTGIFGSVGASVDQVEAGGRKLYGDQRRVLLDTLNDFGAKARLFAKATGGSVTSVKATDDAGLSLAGGFARVSELTARIAPELSGPKFAAAVADTVSASRVGEAAAAAWGDVRIAGPSFAKEISADLGGRLVDIIGALTPGAWPEAAVIDVPDDSPAGPRIIALRGRLAPDIAVTLRGLGGTYDHVMLGRAGVVSVSASLPAGGLDTVHGLALGTERPGVLVTSDAGERVATVRMATDAVAGRAGVNWSVPLGIGAGEASVRWMAGRPGVTVLNASPVPEGPLEWSAGAAAAQRYRTPALAGGEGIRVVPNDPASPMGAIRLQRVSALGDVVSSEVVDPSA